MRATTTAAAGLFCLLFSAAAGREAAATGSLCDGLFVPEDLQPLNPENLV